MNFNNNGSNNSCWIVSFIGVGVESSSNIWNFESFGAGHLCAMNNQSGICTKTPVNAIVKVLSDVCTDCSCPENK